MFLLSGRVPELYAATLGAMKAGVVVSPLFAAFGPEPVRARMEIGDARRAGHDRPALRPQGRRLARGRCRG
jgi:acyl-coenzyme A synthetase/AMP-(fatty) acid ligase